MEKNNWKKNIRIILAIIVFGNAIFFLLLAYFEKLSMEPRALVFIDFWGRFAVYSIWFLGYTLYRAYLDNQPFWKKFVIIIVCLNIPFFLLMGYFNMLSPDPKDLPFVDFWGRITVYSLWFMAYEFYREYLAD